LEPRSNLGSTAATAEWATYRIREKRVMVFMLGNPTFAVAVQSIYDSLKYLKDGGSLEGLQDRQASPALLRSVNRTDEFIQQQQTYFP